VRVCGSTVEGEAPDDLVVADQRAGLTWLCDRCTRDNLRSIESKLDEAWW
jgi:hypothetical protein